MSGPNEHHIPRFFQRAFAVKRKGGEPNEIWLYARGSEPESSSISSTASEDHFYGRELDEKLKVPENRLGAQFANLRKLPVGAVVDSSLAADLIGHLAPRSKHLRASMALGVRQFVSGAQHVFSDPAQLEAMLGLHEAQPGEHFREGFEKAIHNKPQIEALGLPRPVLERVAFYVAKEQFDITVGNSTEMVSAMLSLFSTEAPAMVRDGHNRALEKLVEANPRADRLARFDWSIESAPSGGAILPDCVALAFTPNEPLLPMMFVGEEVYAVVMPLTTNKLLVGRSPESGPVDLTNINEDAAACSEEFFLAHEDSPAFRSLAERIGTRSTVYFEEAVREAVQERLPPSHNQGDEVAGSDTRKLSPPDENDTEFNYNLCLFDFGDQEVGERIANAVAPIVSGFSKVLPLSRIDGITFAVDFHEALRSVDRGRDDLPAIDVAGAGEVGLAGSMVLVVPDGQAKGRIVLSVLVADYLLRESEDEIAFARRVIIHQLVLVAMMELIERAFPGSLLSPTTDDEFQAGLFHHVVDALNGYVAARIAGGFGEGPELAAFYRNSLIAALEQMKSVSEVERAQFVEHREVERVSAALLPLTASALYYAAVLLGHCGATNEDIVDREHRLADILQQLNLSYWLADFGKELEAFRQRFGLWTSLEEFLAFGRHVERLLWSVGVFPWKSPEGIRLELFVPSLETSKGR